MSALDLGERSAVVSSPEPRVTDDHVIYRKRKLGFYFWASAVWLTLLVLSAVFADLLPLKDPNELFAYASRQGPSAAHWFGTDNIGRDVFSRTIYGARRSLLISTVSATIGLLVGGTLGLVSGFYRRGIDATISAIVTILLSIPGLVLVLALMAAFAPPDKSSTTRQTFWAIIGLSILVIPALARITRGLTTAWSDRDFVMASRTLGARNKRMMFREVLPNMIPTMFSFAFLVLATLVILEAALAFFGVSGVSWGVMIESGRSQLLWAPHMVLFPALFMFITILAMNLIGDSMRTRFDVHESGI
jgi:ABC-type dipeptide/oligopeptide/nickel transport system permease subunit